MQRFCPPTILHGAPPSVVHLRSRALVFCLYSLTSILPKLGDRQRRDAWAAATQLIEPDLVEVESGAGVLALAWATFLVNLELWNGPSPDDKAEQNVQEDPFRLTVVNTPRSTGSPVYRDTIVRYLDLGDVWRQALTAATGRQVRGFAFAGWWRDVV